MSTADTHEVAVIQRTDAISEMARFMPVMSLQRAAERRQITVQAVADLMQEGVDFGVIPGTKRPTLYQPGADKLNNLFGLVPQFTAVVKVEDWTGEDHGGEAFFHYEVKCCLYRGEFLMGEGSGSCNSWESKYRWRKTDRVCPACGQAAIIRGKQEYGGGWLCFRNKGGCGAKYKDGDKSIEGQETGNKPNPEVYDLVNTVLKMAMKRAKISATLNATSAHEFFTQDVEDRTLVTWDPAGPPPPPPPPAPPQAQTSGDAELDAELAKFGGASREQRLAMFAQAKAGLIAMLGDAEGAETYYRILAPREHAWQLATMAEAKKAYSEIWRILREGVPVAEEVSAQ